MVNRTTTIARHLRTLRIEHEPRLRLEDVQEATGFNIASLSAWENGINAIPADKLAVLAQFYGVSMDWIAGLTPNRNGIPSARWIIDLDFQDLVEREHGTIGRTDLEPFRCPTEIRKGTLVFAIELPTRSRVATAAEVRRLERDAKGLLQQVPTPLKRFGRRPP